MTEEVKQAPQPDARVQKLCNALNGLPGIEVWGSSEEGKEPNDKGFFVEFDVDIEAGGWESLALIAVSAEENALLRVVGLDDGIEPPVFGALFVLIGDENDDPEAITAGLYRLDTKPEPENTETSIVVASE